MAKASFRGDPAETSCDQAETDDGGCRRRDAAGTHRRHGRRREQLRD